MAADLIMPTLPAEQNHHLPFSGRPHHARHQSYHLPPASTSQLSPLSTSDGTPTGPNSTGTSPSHGSPSSQKGRFRGPLYIPAVLRPNEFPSRPHTQATTPDGTTNGSGPSGDDFDQGYLSLRRASTSFMGIAGMNIFGPRVNPRTAGQDAKLKSGQFNLTLFPQVTDDPTREHWKPDPESTICDHPTCMRNFNYFVRRHHCRKCGNIFCDWHSNWAVPLDQDANFNPRASPSRTCGHCFDMFKLWHSRNNSQASSSASSTDMPHTTPTTPVNAVPGANNLPNGPEIAASVPRDWNWSTF